MAEGVSWREMGAAITVEGLRKAYGPLLAVDDVSFEVAEGEIFGVLGPNGSGKTTSVECIQGLRRADGGHVRVLGLDPRVHRHELRQRIGSQLQESALPDRIKVWEALRLFVALALVNQPEVVFLDEMTTGLDPAARRETWGLIEAIRDQGTTVVLVTHFMDEAERLCDRLAVIKAGRLLALDTPRGLDAAQAGGTRVSFTFSVDAEDLSWLGVPHVHRVQRRGSLVEVDGAGPVVAHVGHALVEHGIEPGDLRVHQPTLEDVYLRLTGPDGREGGSGADAGRDDLD